MSEPTLCAVHFQSAALIIGDALRFDLKTGQIDVLEGYSPTEAGDVLIEYLRQHWRQGVGA